MKKTILSIAVLALCASAANVIPISSFEDFMKIGQGPAASQIKVVDLRGRTVARFTGAGRHTLKSLSTGHYLVEVRHEGRRIAQRMVTLQ